MNYFTWLAAVGRTTRPLVVVTGSKGLFRLEVHSPELLHTDGALLHDLMSDRRGRGRAVPGPTGPRPRWACARRANGASGAVRCWTPAGGTSKS